MRHQACKRGRRHVETHTKTGRTARILLSAAGAAAAVFAGARPMSAATVDWDITPGTVGPGNGTVEGGTGTLHFPAVYGSAFSKITGAVA